MDKMHDKLLILRHDYKYHLSATREMLLSGDIEGAGKYLTDVENELPGIEIKKYCSNKVIDALLNSYAERCAKQDIKLDIDILILDELKVPNYELCIIIGNLMENAVEACGKISHGRMIKLAARSTNMEFTFMMKNSFDGVAQQTDGKPVSTKANGGMGPRSVAEVAAP